VNDPPPTIREFLGHYMQLAHQDRWLTIPVWLGKLVAPLADAYFTWRGQPQDVRRLIDFSGKYTAYSMDKARDLLGWQPQVPLREGIQRCVPYLEEKGLL
jgi:nucleoside-diphosphate-sugar epimerase